MVKIIPVESNKEVQKLFGSQDENIRLIEDAFDIHVSSRAEGIKIASNKKTNLDKSQEFIHNLLDLIRNGREFSKQDVVYCLKEYKKSGRLNMNEERILNYSSSRSVGPRTKGQNEYVEAIEKYDIVFSIGPAGTGKTYLAMAMAVEALKKGQVRRIILTRPAIEAGEKLGYLPGDMLDKVSPYLRPLYDALYDMMEMERIEKYIEMGIIEVAPLAYMRGRTLNDAFIILDEAQNCTHEQMKMFLTRLGFDSKAVITGDITQSDLPGGKPLGLLQAQRILSDIEGIKFVYFSYADVVRHELVQDIIGAYEKANKKDTE
ncbi:MAG: PhoH family protein [Candidatus Omnitrophica bacterium]|nr:PhoH family protein [Candidatus Omnitrophota bacterium]